MWVTKAKVKVLGKDLQRAQARKLRGKTVYQPKKQGDRQSLVQAIPIWAPAEANLARESLNKRPPIAQT